MSESSDPRKGTAAGLIALALLAASALVGWRLLSERDSSTVDSGGFDIASAPAPRRAAPAATASAAPTGPRSGLELLKAAEKIGAPAESLPAAPPTTPAAPSAPAPARTLAQSRQEFTALARRNEAVVRRFAERMTARYPVVRRYGADWMSHPDLRRLTDQYWRDHDPIAFLAGLTRAPGFPEMVKQYAGSPEIREFLVVGLTKEAPHDLVAAGLDLMRDDASLKGMITQVTTSLGASAQLADALGARDVKKPAPAAAK